MQTTGTYSELDGLPVVRFERTFPDTPLAVWEAITDPAQLKEWFPTTVEFERLEAGKLKLDTQLKVSRRERRSRSGSPRTPTRR